MLVFESQSLDIYRNLAIEEYLMEHAVDFGPVLFLWQSDCAVVIGKNQNPWKECRLDLMREEGVPLARRVSGGGTVYHDTGNLNYCVIVDRAHYRETQAFEMVVWALAPFGIRASRSGASNLTLDGLKFSGNAFSFRKGRALHHGTLLLHTDLERLNRYLGSMLDSIETHAISSVPAQVTNLGLGRKEVSSALQASFRSCYQDGEVAHWTEQDLDQDVLTSLILHQQTIDWRFGATPRFLLHRSDGRLEVVKDRIVDAAGIFEADRLIEKRFSDIAFSLVC